MSFDNETMHHDSDQEHPDLAQLSAYVLGKLGETDSLAVETHVQRCADCETQMAAVADQSDDLVDWARHPLDLAAGHPPPTTRTGLGYEIMEELGRGGMAIVYRARHVNLDRIVALKRIRGGQLAEGKERARFRRESEVVAGLDHPHIVKVFDAGEQDGQPYLTMEYLQGGSLAERLETAPLPAGEAAGLLTQLAEAIELAHRQGVIHRDLKPHNVLFATPDSDKQIPTTDRGARVADFGLAKLREHSSHSVTGMLVGTPSYMSPEQADDSSRVSQQSDVYALGVILYECLTGHPPFRAASVLATLDLVRSQAPRPPSEQQPQCPRDLDTICLKCLRKEPARRYRSAAEFKDDLVRFLDGRPILARRTSLVERALKWSYRRPALATSMAITTALLITLMVGGWLVSLKLQSALAERTAAQEQTEKSLKHARAAWNGNLWATGVGVLKEYPHTLSLRRRLLDTAVSQYEELFADEVQHADTRHAFHVLLVSLADLQGEQGQDKESEATYRDAMERADRLAGEFPGDSRYSFHTATVRAHLGTLLNRLERYPEAETLLRQATRTMKAHTRGIQNASRMSSLAESLDFLALSYRSNGSLEEARQRQREAAKLAQDALELAPQDPAVLRVAYQTLHNRALHLADQTERKKLLKQAVDLTETLVEQPGASRRDRQALADMLLSLAAGETSVGKSNQDNHIVRARELYEGLSRRFPQVVSYIDGTARAHYSLASLLRNRGEHQQAAAAIEKSLELQVRALQLDDSDERRRRWAETLNHRGLCRAHLNQLALAEDDYRRALSAQETLVQRHSDLLTYSISATATRVNLAELLRQSKKLPDALAMADRAVNECQRWQKKDPRNVQLRDVALQAYGSRALVSQAMSRWNEALADWDRVVILSGNSAAHRRGRAWALLQAGRSEQAATEGIALAQQGRVTVAEIDELARLLAQCATKVATDQQISPQKRRELSSRCTENAVSLAIRAASAKTLHPRPKAQKQEQGAPKSDTKPQRRSVLGRLFGRPK